MRSFIKECIHELLYVIGSWIKANILVFCSVTVFFVLIIGINPINTLDDAIGWSIMYSIFIFITFDKKPNLKCENVKNKYDEQEKVNIKQNNISLINIFKNTKK